MIVSKMEGGHFPVWVCDEIAEGGDRLIPDPDWLTVRLNGCSLKWNEYDNALERKSCSEDFAGLKFANRQLFHHLTSQSACELARNAVGDVPAMWPDYLSHGGGLHLMREGDFLAPHVDYAKHPRVPNAERALNLVVFLTGEFDGEKPPTGGGLLEFWDADAKEIWLAVRPKPHRAVIWVPGDDTFHSVSRVTSGCRMTANASYLKQLSPGVTRTRALFVPPRLAPPVPHVIF